MAKASGSKFAFGQTESDKASLWNRFDGKRLQQATSTALGTQHQASGKKTRKRKLRWVVDAVLPLVLTTIAGVAVLLPSSLPHSARLALFAFLLAAILWSTTSISADYIALFTTMLLVLTGGTSQEQLFDALASDVIWLMIGAFVLGGVVQKTGLAGRLTQLIVSRAKTVKGVFWLLVTVLIPMSFLIPSTSGRAAQWMIDQLISISSITNADSGLLILVTLAFISLTSHLYMTSHTARAAALVPALLYLGNSLQLNPIAVMFISTVGMDYCLTFPVGSKALLMFQELEGETYKPSNLLRLSSVLLPVHLGLMVLFYYTYWHWVGLKL